MTSQAAVIHMEAELHEDTEHKESLSPEYLEFLRRNVEAARADIAAGRWKTHEQIEAEHTTRCARVLAGHARLAG